METRICCFPYNTVLSENNKIFLICSHNLHFRQTAKAFANGIDAIRNVDSSSTENVVAVNAMAYSSRWGWTFLCFDIIVIVFAATSLIVTVCQKVSWKMLWQCLPWHLPGADLTTYRCRWCCNHFVFVLLFSLLVVIVSVGTSLMVMVWGRIWRKCCGSRYHGIFA